MRRIRGTKKQKQRITVFLVCNADGSERFDAMVIGHAETPVAFRQAGFIGTRKGNLPLTYRHNDKAWMLSRIWYEFLENLNHKIKSEGRQIFLGSMGGITSYTYLLAKDWHCTCPGEGTLYGL